MQHTVRSGARTQVGFCWLRGGVRFHKKASNRVHTSELEVDQYHERSSRFFWRVSTWSGTAAMACDWPQPGLRGATG